MSLAFKVYCKKVSKDIIPKIMKRLNDFDMVVSVHPNFKLDGDEDSGFLPFKFRFTETHLDILKGKELKSGFEIYIDDFDLHTEKENLTPKLGFFDKLRGKTACNSVFIKLWREVKHSALNHYFAFVVN